jgi:hypothetical protein
MQEKNKLCSRCTLGHLSFYFSKQSTKEIKFYLTDIIFDHVEIEQKLKIYEWNFINKLVSSKMKKESTQLNERKNNTRSCNLFLIANEIVIALGCTQLLIQRMCSNCIKFRFHLVYVPCCKNFMCVHCLTSFTIKKRKCTLCYKDLYQNHQEFTELLTNLCLTGWQMADLEIELRNSLIKKAIKNPLIAKCAQEKDYYLHLKFGTIITMIDKNTFPWDKVLRPDPEILESLETPEFIAITTIESIISACIQMVFLPWGSKRVVFRNGFWVLLNVFISIFAVKIKNILFSPNTTRKHKNVHWIFDEVAKSFICCFNFMTGWFIIQNRYFAQDLNSVIYFSFFSIPLAFFITDLIKSILLAHFEKKKKFDFY